MPNVGGTDTEELLWSGGCSPKWGCQPQTQGRADDVPNSLLLFSLLLQEAAAECCKRQLQGSSPAAGCSVVTFGTREGSPSCHSQALQVLQHLMLFISKPSFSAPETRGVNGNSLKWLRPFLCKQRSCCGNYSSTPKPSAQASEEACFAPGRNVGRSLSNKCSPSHANNSVFVFSCN